MGRWRVILGALGCALAFILLAVQGAPWFRLMGAARRAGGRPTACYLSLSAASVPDARALERLKALPGSVALAECAGGGLQLTACLPPDAAGAAQWEAQARAQLPGPLAAKRLVVGRGAGDPGQAVRALLAAWAGSGQAAQLACGLYEGTAGGVQAVARQDGRGLRLYLGAPQVPVEY